MLPSIAIVHLNQGLSISMSRFVLFLNKLIKIYIAISRATTSRLSRLNVHYRKEINVS